MNHPKRSILLIFLATFVLLIFTRFVNLGWGLPYPMHPDERNMAAAIMQLKCDTTAWVDCLNPEFFAYGQLPLYAAYFGIKVAYFSTGDIGNTISFEDAAFALRLISALSAVLTGVLLYLSLVLLASFWFNKAGKKRHHHDIFFTRITGITSLVIVFVPGLIQFAHFGTTESLLILAYTALTWLSLRLFAGMTRPIDYAIYTGFITGLALASKLSALAFGPVPVIALLLSFPIKTKRIKSKKRKLPTKAELIVFAKTAAKYMGYLFIFGGLSLLIGILFSPYNFIKYDLFYSSMDYESGVGVGRFMVFYTRSFFDTAPILFHISRIFPFVLGLPLFILFILGFIFLPWNKKEFLFIRFVFLLNFLAQAFFYAKWVRFIAPVYPIMTLIGTAFLIQFYFFIKTTFHKAKKRLLISKAVLASIILVTILPGMAFLSIYVKPDIRYYASDWIYKNIPEESVLLAETANVVDVPIVPANQNWATRNYRYISFDFYNLDTDFTIQQQLETSLQEADYIIVNSRRVFKNHTCLVPVENRYKPLLSIDQTIPVPAYLPLENPLVRCGKLTATYPRLQNYYSDLFSGKSGYKMVAEFTSYPEISFFGTTLIDFPDENAEETWTVFDHPVIRIYKKQ